MKTGKAIVLLTFFTANLDVYSQDYISVYDVASQTLSQRAFPDYNLNAVADSTPPSFGMNGISTLPVSYPTVTYPFSNVSLLQKAADYYSSFNFPFTAVTLIRYGYNITTAIIGRRALLVYKFDVRQPNSHWRSLDDANPFYENGAIQYGFSKLTPVKYYMMNSPDTLPVTFAIVEVAEDIGSHAGYFGLAFDTTGNAYDSLILYNICYPKKDNFNLYPDSTNGDTLCMKYGLPDNYSQDEFGSYFGGDGEYVSPFFDNQFRIRGARWSVSTNYFIGRKGFYFLKYVVDSLATPVVEIDDQQHLSIFPNPATTRITLFFGKPLKTKITLHIFNALGQVVEARQIPSGELFSEVDVSRLERGCYILTIIDSDQMKIGKFITR